MSHHHLSIEERACIGRYIREKLTISEIAELIERDKATISRNHEEQQQEREIQSGEGTQEIREEA